MQCQIPPPLTDDQITSAVDGQANQAVQEHLARCEGCAARVREAQQFEQSMRSSLGRWDCPSAQRLTDHHFALLAPSEEQALLQHLAICPRCSAELAELKLFLAEADVVPERVPARGIAIRLRELVAQIVPRAPALALRGAGREPIVAQVEGTMIVLDLQPAGEGKITLVGQVVAEDQDVWTGAMVEIRRAGEVLGVTTVDNIGGFRGEALSPGAASIRITPGGGLPAVLVPEIALVG